MREEWERLGEGGVGGLGEGGVRGLGVGEAG